MELSLQVESGNVRVPESSTAIPKVLLTDTDRRPYAARLALVLTEAGCEVSAVCSLHGHPLRKTNVRPLFPYSALRPVDSLSRAIQATKPDIVIPCDDRGVRHLHELYARARNQGAAGNWLRELLERSLGSPESFATVSGRFELLRIAGEEGLRVPRTREIKNSADFEAWQSEQPFPWVLKADETWGGRGVRIARTRAEAEQFFLEVSRPFRLRRAIKRMVVNRDPFWLQPWWENRKPAVIAQAYIPGQPANCAVVCWQGKMLAGIGVEVVSCDGPTGPASVVRVVDNPEMMLCAERLARRLNLSGFFGLDFMMEEKSGQAYLIEMNPRCTPLCHLRLGNGRDMIGELWARLAGKPAPTAAQVTENSLIAYFPQAWNSKSEYLATSFHDIPKGEPELIREFLSPWPERSLLFRLLVRLEQWKEIFSSTAASKSTGYSRSQS